MLGLLEEHAAQLKTRKSGSSAEVWDPFRKKWVLLGPEEFVRQVMMSVWLAEGRFSGLIPVIEKSVVIEGRSLRFDAVLMKGIDILIVIEFKSPDEKLGETHLLQLSRYNSVLTAPGMILSNGLNSRFFKRLPSGYSEVTGWEDLDLA